MGIYATLPDELDEVDIIIAGGGAAGCVLAARVAAADPSLSILVIEAGRDNWQNPNVVVPALYMTHLLPETETGIFYTSKPSQQLAGREIVVNTGGTLGGGSSVNFMIYARAQRSDFDSWKTPGWGADDLVPYLKKIETYHGPGSPGTHGFSGPMHVTHSTYRSTPVEREFIRAASAVGFPEMADLNDLDSNNGVAPWLKTISPDGTRQDAAHAYLHPLLREEDGTVGNEKYLGLNVLVETMVVKVLFEEGEGGEKVARGVEVVPKALSKGVVGKGDVDKIRSMKARKMVVLSAGAMGTPQVLERSGVGDKAVLEKAGVEVVVDLPGVGADYQDHNLLVYPYYAEIQPHETIDSLFAGRDDFTAAIQRGDPRVGWNGFDANSKVRPREDEIDALGEKFREAWDQDFKEQTNRPIMMIVVGAGFIGDATLVPPGEYISCGTYSTYPYSRGHVHITGPNVGDKVDFDCGYLSDAGGVDLKKFLWAYKKQREVVRRMSMYRGEIPEMHPPFSPTSAAACGSAKQPHHLLTGPTREEAIEEDIKYSAEDDAVIERFLRERITCAWHSLGTARMAPRERKGVVDMELNVHGVKGLKVVDLSIAPENVGANTTNTAMVIGEKGADIVLKELGLV